MEEWRILPFQKARAVENMAVDEAVFRENIRKKAPTLRFYGWRVPALSIGYFQDYEKEVDSEACRRFGVDIIRRPTGGKAVLHEQELTYAVIAGADSPLFPPDILKTYRVISNCIAKGLAEVGIRAEMKADGRQAPGGTLRSSCFFFPSRYELLVGGRKICGSAQMRSRGVFLQHGSLLLRFDPLRTCAVMLPHRDLERDADLLRNSVTSVGEQAGPLIDEENLCRVLREGFEQTLGIRIREGPLTPEEEGLRDELMMKKYGSEGWNREGRKSEWISGL
ncbi:MAG: biotin/lipoate A/B protein ligase family protein [Deltaproteobacteria bacterium]|nr:biotin/lipoate A/B protein ligase family protein [Deltaproteobacteria bacterium]